MATAVGTQSDLKDMLKSLIELEYDALAAYKSAVERLESADIKQTMGDFMADHNRHVNDLSEVMRQMGETPPTSGDAKQLLAQGKVVLANMMGDKQILKAMETNEDDTNTAYERATARGDAAVELKTLFQSSLSDERRHREWIRSRIAQM